MTESVVPVLPVQQVKLYDDAGESRECRTIYQLDLFANAENFRVDGKELRGAHNGRMKKAIQELQHKSNMWRESWIGMSLQIYVNYWLAHTFEQHLDTLSLNEQATEEDAYKNTSVIKFGSDRDGHRFIVIDTGLTLDLLHDMQPIYAFFRERSNPAPKLDTRLSRGAKWDLWAWKTKEEATKRIRNEINPLAVIADFPEVARFPGFEEKFDPRIEIVGANDEHFWQDDKSHNRIQRVLEGHGYTDEAQQRHMLKAALSNTLLMAKRDLDIARMHAFRDKQSRKSSLQFLLPLFLSGDSDHYDLAMAITTRQPITHTSPDNGEPENYTYHAMTVLEPDQAFRNCRLLGRVRQAWLLSSGGSVEVCRGAVGVDRALEQLVDLQQTVKGTINTLKHDHGWIKSNEFKGQLYFQFSDSTGLDFNLLKKGSTVTFCVVTGEKGLKAVRVESSDRTTVDDGVASGIGAPVTAPAAAHANRQQHIPFVETCHIARQESRRSKCTNVSHEPPAGRASDGQWRRPPPSQNAGSLSSSTYSTTDTAT